MTTDFSSLNLHPNLVQVVAELGYTIPTDVQVQVVPLMLAGKDIIAQSQTGSGKTAAFALPVLQNLIYNPSRGRVQALVLTPTRELAIQVADAIKKYGRHIQVEVMAVYGGQHYGTSKRRLKHGVDIIVGTPGRLQDLMRQNILDLGEVRTLILDEADEMLSMGFIEDIENILSHTPTERQTTLFSATMSKSIRQLADRYMRQPQAITIARKQLTVASIEQRYYMVNEKDKLAALTRLFEVEDIGATLVFTRTRASSAHVAAELIQRGFSAEAINGDLAQEARIRVLTRFRSNQIKILVATDVAARGLDIDDISHVFNFDLPTDHEAYVHRVGRTGRAGKTGIAISLITPREKGMLKRIENYTKQPLTLADFPTEQDILQRRENLLVDRLTVWIDRDRSKREQEIVEALVAEGRDPIKVAAAALKLARAEEKQRPVESIGEVKVKSSKSTSGPRRPTSSAGKGKTYRKNAQRSGSSRSGFSHEEGMVRLAIGRGRDHGINPGEVVGVIASRANIPGHGIGKILITDQQTLLDVQEEFVSRVLGHTGSYQFREHRHVTIERV
ncbi:MAG: DEAD/DEAH box helicase [Anaerolineae bacterium]|nr:DEAD/DEAH box helicase [Anaerolineae bacterium]